MVKPGSDAGLRYLVSTSDYIRRELLELLITNNTPLEECYHTIHRVHFSDEEKALSIGACDKHSGRDTSLPMREHDSLNLLPLSTLYEIKSSIFSAIENTGYDGDFSDYITTLDMLITLCHIPHDGAGRTNEDFLVLYALRHGMRISFSEDGYRGQLNAHSLVHERYRNVKGFQEEILATGLEGHIDEREIETVCKEHNRDFEDIVRKKQAEEPAFVEFQLKKRKAAYLLLNALQNPNDNIPYVKAMFPKSFSVYQNTLAKAEKQIYQHSA